MRFSPISKPIFLLILVFSFLGAGFFIFAELTPQEERGVLENELKELEDKIAQYEGDITKTQQEKNTLQNQISILKKKIEKLNLQIQQSNTLIKDISFQVKDTEASIGKTSLKIEDSREKLADILRLIYEENQKPLIEILLSNGQLSDFFNNLMALEDLNSKSQELLLSIKSLKTNLEGQKQNLDEEKEDLERITEIQILQREESVGTKREQEKLLEQSKGKESEYQKLLSATKKRAVEIRARIFELIGVPKAPTFGEAYSIAKFVSGITGLRPAFLLAVLTQESNIGKNVGQCYLKNPTTGDGVRVLSGQTVAKVMKPSRDVSYFLGITQELGRDPYNTPVSCPIPSVGGYGGAMGPAQFIPETWAKAGYGKKVEDNTGKKADPWNINDAFLAAGLYLEDLGGIKDEFRAAMRYFSGNSWTKSEEFYGKSVLEIARRYEEDIKTLEANPK